MGNVWMELFTREMLKHIMYFMELHTNPCCSIQTHSFWLAFALPIREVTLLHKLHVNPVFLYKHFKRLSQDVSNTTVSRYHELGASSHLPCQLALTARHLKFTSTFCGPKSIYGLSLPIMHLLHDHNQKVSANHNKPRQRRIKIF